MSCNCTDYGEIETGYAGVIAVIYKLDYLAFRENYHQGIT